MRKIKKWQATKRTLPLIVVAILALTMALPVLADGPPDQSGKGCKGQQRECPETGQQDNPGQTGEQSNNGKAQEDHGLSGEQSNNGKPQEDHGLSGKQRNNGKAQEDHGLSGEQSNNGKAQEDHGLSGEQRNNGKAQEDHGLSGKQGNNGNAQEDHGLSGEQGNNGKAQEDPGLLGKQGNSGKAQQEKVSPPVTKGQGKAQRGGSSLLGQQEPGLDSAVISRSDTLYLCRETGKPKPVSRGISQADAMVTIRSGSDGLKNLRITVNGRRFQVDGLLERQGPVLLDVSSAMATRESSTIVFTPLGKPGTCAWVDVGR